MAKHSAPTLVRLFQHKDRVANLLVDDWEDLEGWARFTIPSEHPRAHWLADAALAASASAIVMESTETEWMIVSVTSGVRRDVEWPDPDWLRSFHEVKLISRALRIRQSQLDDDRCIAVFGVEQ